MAKGRGERREFRRQHVRAWRQSGQRRKEYCREHDLNPQTFNVWVGRLRDEFRPSGRGSDDADSADTATSSPGTQSAPAVRPRRGASPPGVGTLASHR
jgi:transposase-like protein